MHEASLIEIVFPHLAGMAVERVELVDDVVQIWVRSRSTRMACPDCAIVSEAVHSRYQRRLSLSA